MDPLSLPADAAAHPAPRRALVLGGGGSTGNAWLLGVLAGLAEGGVDVASADLVVGTSAGATAAAQLLGGSLAGLLREVLETPVPPSPIAATSRPVVDHLERMRTLIASAHNAAELRRRIADAAFDREAASDGTWQEQWRATVLSRLPSRDWPAQRLLLTAIGAGGEPVVFDAASGVALVDAVAASCSSGLPFRIGGEPYLDGGFRRNENADLASGSERVLVLSPLGGRSLTPPEWGSQLAVQLDELRAGGSLVDTLVPTAESEHLFGAVAMNPALRPVAARAGHELGVESAPRLAAFWG
ncbi:patatin-like phospholipase family protein [Rathayibacter sp. VKM Ac-2878]|nr:patatin-like phospholipase family protein [Rathayibacter sp. VKM Ac-2879]MBF4503879.1 patatin-like phospholipase family protein [Rathayibacter sp. VKM Ac-2878]